MREEKKATIWTVIAIDLIIIGIYLFCTEFSWPFLFIMCGISIFLYKIILAIKNRY